MEGFNNKNIERENKEVSLVLDTEKIGEAFLGKDVEVAASELIKIFSIIKHIKEKRFSTSGEVESAASDLIKEFNVVNLKYKTVFTSKVIYQILNSTEINSVSLEFNEEPLIANSGSTVESVVEAWGKLGFYSIEAIKGREKELENQKKFIKHEQAILDRMFIELDTYDFTNQEKLVDWLYEYYTHYIQEADMYKNKLLEKFKAHGYLPEDNDKINGMLGKILKNKEQLGRVIIGYLLMNGSLALRGDGLKNSIIDWKKI